MTPTTEAVVFRAPSMSAAWRLAANWCIQRGRIPVECRQVWAGGGCRRLQVESVQNPENILFDAWAASDMSGRKNQHGIPIVSRATMQQRDKDLAEANRQATALRRDFEIAMRAREGGSGPWGEKPWLGDTTLAGMHTAPLKHKPATSMR